jgi:hypothetical protein
MHVHVMSEWMSERVGGWGGMLASKKRVALFVCCGIAVKISLIKIKTVILQRFLSI